MTGDFDIDLGITLERRNRVVQHWNALGQQGGAVRFELHTLQQQLLVERATGVIDAFAPGRVGTLVHAVDDAIAVTVELTASLVHLRARGGVRALVAAVANAVTVAVELAAAGVHFHSGRCAGALVDVVGDAVTVVILRQRASRRIDRRPGGRAGALVRVVVDAVAIAVDATGRATPGILDSQARDVVDGKFLGGVGGQRASRTDVGAQLHGAAVVAILA